MAKKPKNADPLAQLESLSLVDSMFDEICEENKKQFGEDMVYTGDEADKLMVCLPVPSLSVRLLLRNEGLPLGKCIMVIGEQESFKSSLCDEFGRWHRMEVQLPATPTKPARVVKVGKEYKFEVENKQWSELTNSIHGYDPRAIETFACKSLDGPEDGWMVAMTKTFQNVKDRFEPLVQQGPNKGNPKEGAPGRIAPACYVVDSIMGALCESGGDKIESNGAPAASFANEARKITDYMKMMPKWCWLWPFTVMGVNHKKVHVSPDGRKHYTIPGGAALKFHESIELDMYRKAAQFTRLNDNEHGVRVGIRVNKNSCGPRQVDDVEVEVNWWYDENDVNELGQPRQVTIFDWHSATIEILIGQQVEKIAKQIDEIADLHANVNTRKVWSSTLGIPEKSQVRWREAGAMLEERPDLLYALYDVLGIRRRYLFTPGVDFRKQFDFLRQELAKEKAQVAKVTGPPKESL